MSFFNGGFISTMLLNQKLAEIDEKLNRLDNQVLTVGNYTISNDATSDTLEVEYTG